MSRYFHTFNIKKIIFTFLILASLLRIFQFFYLEERFWDNSDFRNLYLAQKLFLQKKDFYNDDNLQSELQRISQEENINFITNPGFPSLPLLYPPWAVPFFIPFNIFSWKTSVVIWVILNTFFLIGSVLFILMLFDKKFNSKTIVEISIIILAFKGTLPELSVGQPLFFILFLGFLSLYYSKMNRWIISGILLGIACMKFTIAFPFYLYLLVKNQFKSLTLGVIIPLILLFGILFIYKDPCNLIYSYIDNILYYRQDIAFNILFIKSMTTEVGAVIIHFLPSFFPFLTWGYLVIFASVIISIYLKKRELTDLYIFLICSLLTLCFSYHLYYDSLILLPIYFLFDKIELKWKFILILLLIPMFLPIYTILRIFEIQDNFLYLIHSFSLLVLFLVLYFKPTVFNKN